MVKTDNLGKVSKLVPFDERLYKLLAEENEFQIFNGTEFNKRFYKKMNVLLKQHLLAEYDNRRTQMYGHIGYWTVKSNYQSHSSLFEDEMEEISKLNSQKMNLFSFLKNIHRLLKMQNYVGS